MSPLPHDMFPIGLDPADPRGYGAIARAASTLAERTGRVDEAGAWTGRQVVARFFIIGFGNEVQCTTLLPRLTHCSPSRSPSPASVRIRSI